MAPSERCAVRLVTMTTRKPPASTPPVQNVPPVAELPVTRSMLLGVRDELRARIDGTNARIDGTNARIDETNARFDKLEANFERLRAELLADVHRLGTLLEEQELRNRVVYEAVQGHSARVDRVEADVAEMRGMFREIMAALRSPR